MELNFQLQSEADAKNGKSERGNKNHTTYFWYVGSFDEKKRTYQNDMKSTNKTEMHMLGNELLPFCQFHDM